MKLKEILLEKKEVWSAAENNFGIVQFKLKLDSGAKFPGAEKKALLTGVWEKIQFKGLVDVIIKYKKEEDAEKAISQQNSAELQFIVKNIIDYIDVGTIDAYNLIILDTNATPVQKGKSISIKMYVVVLNEKNTSEIFKKYNLQDMYSMNYGRNHKIYNLEDFLKFTKIIASKEEQEQNQKKFEDSFIGKQHVLLVKIGPIPFRQGQRGKKVMWLRELLGEYWEEDEELEPFDKKLEAYLKQWQIENGVTPANGEWNKDTYDQFWKHPEYVINSEEADKLYKKEPDVPVDDKETITTIPIPFKYRVEGNRFRKWVNKNHPEFNENRNSKLTDSGSLTHKDFIDAWNTYGKKYTDAGKVEDNKITDAEIKKACDNKAGWTWSANKNKCVKEKKSDGVDEDGETIKF